MKGMCVIGSFNIDIMAAMERFPGTGETLAVDTFDLQVGGGKGANQAVALGRLGAPTMMVGKLGDRFYGLDYLETLKRNGVSCEAVEVIPNAFPGAAFVAVDANRDNMLFIYPGTNALVDPEQIDRYWSAISSCEVFLFQLEIPLQTTLHAMRRLRSPGRILLLDPAPARELSDEMIALPDYLTPNEVELSMLTGLPVESEDSFREACEVLLRRGARAIVAKAGRRGAFLADGQGFRLVPGYRVETVDPTAAGDSFNAGFALALAEGQQPMEAIRFGNAVAALSTTALGAQPAMPTRLQVDAFLRTQQA